MAGVILNLLPSCIHKPLSHQSHSSMTGFGWPMTTLTLNMEEGMFWGFRAQILGILLLFLLLHSWSLKPSVRSTGDIGGERESHWKSLETTGRRETHPSLHLSQASKKSQHSSPLTTVMKKKKKKCLAESNNYRREEKWLLLGF